LCIYLRERSCFFLEARWISMYFKEKNGTKKNELLKLDFTFRCEWDEPKTTTSVYLFFLKKTSPKFIFVWVHYLWNLEMKKNESFWFLLIRVISFFVWLFFQLTLLVNSGYLFKVNEQNSKTGKCNKSFFPHYLPIMCVHVFPFWRGQLSFIFKNLLLSVQSNSKVKKKQQNEGWMILVLELLLLLVFWIFFGGGSFSKMHKTWKLSHEFCVTDKQKKLFLLLFFFILGL